uniref:Uncharacterized protein n=1 Tax=Rhizophora mucronata TaxID=61149 RepID=A0A2P2PLF0_RHIMU
MLRSISTFPAFASGKLPQQEPARKQFQQMPVFHVQQSTPRDWYPSYHQQEVQQALKQQI